MKDSGAVGRGEAWWERRWVEGRKEREDREAAGARRRLGRKRDWVKGGGDAVSTKL